MFQTEYGFTLPKGYVDKDGNLHKKGIMRLAIAADEILPLKNPKIRQNPADILSKVIIKLGNLTKDEITPTTIEGLFASDLAYLQEFYQKINGDGTAKVKAKCPNCEHSFEVDIGSGE